MGARIILAEDNQDLILLVKDFLDMMGHGLTVVSNGRALLSKTLELKPHLIMSDINLPGLKGPEACAELRKDPKTAAIPVIFMSAHPYADVKDILPQEAGVRFLEKPLELAKLEALLDELLPLGGYPP